jgi:hypothetical protein
MKTKYDIAAITNGYISQLHYSISTILDLNADPELHKDLDKILELTEQFKKRIISEQQNVK